LDIGFCFIFAGNTDVMGNARTFQRFEKVKKNAEIIERNFVLLQIEF